MKKEKKDAKKAAKAAAEDSAIPEEAPAATSGNPEDKKTGGMPANIERRLSVTQSERKRSMGKEDAEWIEAEVEQLQMIDPCKAATKEAEAKADSDTKEKGGLSTAAERKLSMIGMDRRRSMGIEDAEFVESEAESMAILATEETAVPSPPVSANLGSPEYQEDPDGYSADALVGESDPAPAPADAPVLATDAPTDVDSQRRKSLEGSERRRSMGGEDAEWVAAEVEQKKLLLDPEPGEGGLDAMRAEISAKVAERAA